MYAKTTHAQLSNKIATFSQDMDNFSLLAAAKVTREIVHLLWQFLALNIDNYIQQGDLIRSLPIQQSAGNVPAVFLSIKVHLAKPYILITFP